MVFKQVITTATRITKCTTTLIDVILTTHPANLINTKVVPSALSDHDLIGCIRKIHNTKAEPKVVKCRNYRTYNPDVINAELKSHDWTYVFSSSSANKAWIFT